MRAAVIHCFIQSFVTFALIASAPSCTHFFTNAIKSALLLIFRSAGLGSSA